MALKRILIILSSLICLNANSQSLKIGQLPVAAPITGVEILPVTQNYSTRGATVNQLKSFFFPLYSGTAIKYLSDSAGYFSWRTVTGGGGSFVDLSTTQTVGGVKTFTNGLIIATGSSLQFITAYGNDVINSSGFGRTFSLDPNAGGILATQQWSNLTKFNIPTGTTSQYIRGDGTLATYTGGGGGTTYNNIQKTANYTAVVLDKYIECNGTFTITLPTAVGNTNTEINVKNTGTGNITIVCFGSETIDGSVNKILSFQNQSQKYISNGTNWKIY